MELGPSYPARTADAEAVIEASTRVMSPALTPELRVHMADLLLPVWEATERHAGSQVAPPFWAFAWPGSQALARYLLDHPYVVVGRRVLDFAAGNGLAGIAAARAGARHVLASDLDPFASAAQRLNAALNGVELEVTTVDLVGRDLPAVDVVLAGDVCYERFPAARIVAWLRRLAAHGKLVLLADPKRAYAPTSGLQQVASYVVPTSKELEASDRMETLIWRLLPAEHG